MPQAVCQQAIEVLGHEKYMVACRVIHPHRMMMPRCSKLAVGHLLALLTTIVRQQLLGQMAADIPTNSQMALTL